MGISKIHPIFCQPVNIRGLNAFGAVNTNITKTQIIGINDYDIWFFYSGLPVRLIAGHNGCKTG